MKEVLKIDKDKMNLIRRVSDVLNMLVTLVGLRALTNTLRVVLTHLNTKIPQFLKNSNN